MNFLTIDVRSVRDLLAYATFAKDSGKAIGPRCSFFSPQAFICAVSGRRFDLIQTLSGVGPVTIREVARRVDHDLKAARSNVNSLLAIGVLDKTAVGRVVFPYDVMQVDSILEAA